MVKVIIFLQFQKYLPPISYAVVGAPVSAEDRQCFFYFGEKMYLCPAIKRSTMEVPKYLLRRKYQLESVLFIVLFSVIFMLVYQPFSVTAWFGLSPAPRLFMTLCFYLVAISIMLLSKQLFAYFHAERELSVRVYLLWIAAEFILIALTYTAFTAAFDLSGTALTLPLVGRIILCVSLILAIPYTLITLYTAYRAQKEELNLMRFEQEQQNEPPKSRLIRFSDNNGVPKMAVEESALYYIESQDNYVRIYYELDGRLESYMLRCKTQTLEESLLGTSLMRCHRSYIVNMRKISRFKHEHERAKITLSHPSAKPIPVSKSYCKQLSELLENYLSRPEQG